MQGQWPNRWGKTKEHRAWTHLRARCTCPTNQNFKEYGARGITFPARWDDFDAFFEDVGPAPSPDHTLDRIDGEKGYSKENCRWATRLVQSRNRSYCKIQPEVAAEIRTLYATGNYRQVDLAERFGVSQIRISQILRRLNERTNTCTNSSQST